MKQPLILIVIIFFISYLSNGQGSIPTIAFAGKTVKDIVKDFENTGNRLMSNAQTMSINVASKFGNEILIATQNLNYYFEKNIDKAFNNLKIEEQNIFIELNKIIDQFNYFNQSITKISELTNLDLIEFTNRIAVLTKKIDYYISSINGTTLINSDVNYSLNVTGLGFGLNDSRQKYSTAIYVNNNALPVTSIDLTQRRQMVLNIPNNLIKPLFKSNKIVYVPIKIVSEITKLGNFLGWGKSIKKYQTDFNLVLMPAVAGEITISETVTEKVLDDKILTHAITKSFGKECQTDHPCYMDEPWSCSLNQKIIAVEYSCAGQCQFSYNKRIGGGSADFEISDDSTSVRVFRHVDGADNTTVIYTVKYKNYVDDNKVVNNKTLQLKYGEPFDVVLNLQNPNCNYSILGKLITGQKINYNNNTIGSSPDLKLLGVGKTGNICKASFKLIPQ